MWDHAPSSRHRQVRTLIVKRAEGLQGTERSALVLELKTAKKEGHCDLKNETGDRYEETSRKGLGE